MEAQQVGVRGSGLGSKEGKMGRFLTGGEVLIIINRNEIGLFVNRISSSDVRIIRFLLYVP